MCVIWLLRVHQSAFILTLIEIVRYQPTYIPHDLSNSLIQTSLPSELATFSDHNHGLALRSIQICTANIRKLWANNPLIDFYLVSYRYQEDVGKFAHSVLHTGDPVAEYEQNRQGV